MLRKKAFGPWSEISGWIFMAIVLITLFIIIASTSGNFDISFLSKIGG